MVIYTTLMQVSGNAINEETAFMSKRILIAEDDQFTREMLVTAATMRGYDVISVPNGVELLTIATDETFDVVITDLMMPDLDGASATEIMRLQGNTTPVIVMTGLSHNDLRLVGTKFNKIFHKPLNISELFDFVESLPGK